MEIYNKQAEQAVLGGVMMWSNIIEEITLTPEDFYEYRHGELYATMLERNRTGQPIDPVNLSTVLPRINGLDAIYLHELYSMAPGSSVKVPPAAAAVAGLSQGRKMRALAARISEAVEETPWDKIGSPLDTLRREFDTVSENVSNVRVRTFAEMLEESVEAWKKPADKNFKPTGWEEMDDVLNGGWKPGQLTVWGARPAVGKSALASCATVAAHNYGVGFFSLEMTELELMGRMVAIHKGIQLGNITRHDMTSEDWERLEDLRAEAPNWRVFLEARPRRTIEQMRATLRAWNRYGHVPLVVVDYLQIVQGTAESGSTRERVVSKIAEDLKIMAKEFDCHVLALAQLSRDGAERPTMAHLRESGGIEAHADNIGLLHRDESRPDEIDVDYVKNRHGATQLLTLAWRPQFSSANTMGGSGRSYAFGMENK